MWGRNRAWSGRGTARVRHRVGSAAATRAGGSGGAARGSEELTTTGIYAYSLFDTSGANISGLLGYNHAQSKLFFGAVSNGTGGGAATAPGSASSWPAASQSSTADPGGAGDTDDGPTATPPTGNSGTDPLAAPAATPSPTREVASPAVGFSTPMPLAALVLVAAAAFGCGVLITRRGRGR